MIMGMFSGLKTARMLDDAGVFDRIFGSPMRNLAAFCVTIFLVMLVYALYWGLSERFSRRAKILIGAILWCWALFSFVTMPRF